VGARGIVAIVMGEAERRLQEARARADGLSSAIHAAQGFGDWEDLVAAEQEVLAAERAVARIAKDAYAVELDVEVPWDTGAPLPHLLANGHRAYLLFYLADPDPDWDGTWARAVDPAAREPEPLAVVEFHNVHAVTLGGPNDEALEGHPLHGKGLRPYAAHLVVNSRWIVQAEQVNSVHPHHRGGWHDRLNHYVFCFHDETFECLAEGFTTERHLSTPRAVLSDLLGRLLE
jgi:hypothetical protein